MSGILRVKSFFLKFVTRFNKERMGPIFRPMRRSSSACSSFLSFENSVSAHSSQQDSFCLVPIIMYRYFVFFWMSYHTMFFSPYCHTVQDPPGAAAEHQLKLWYSLRKWNHQQISHFYFPRGAAGH